MSRLENGNAFSEGGGIVDDTVDGVEARLL
jgi:hypothetical protein